MLQLGALAAFPAPNSWTEDRGGGGGHARDLGENEREEGKREMKLAKV